MWGSLIRVGGIGEERGEKGDQRDGKMGWPGWRVNECMDRTELG